MKKKYRLRKRRDFSKTYRRGKSSANRTLVLVYRRNGLSVSRLGISVNKKFGNAVKRNKIKRQLKEIYRSNIDDVKPGYDLIFIVRVNAQDKSFWELKKSLESLLKRVKLLKNKG